MDHDQYLKQKGVRVSSGWLQQWQQEAARVDSSFKHKTASAQRALLWQEVLRGDLHVIGAQALPADLQVRIMQICAYICHLSMCCMCVMPSIFRSRRSDKSLALLAGVAQASTVRHVCPASR